MVQGDREEDIDDAHGAVSRRRLRKREGKG
jgi:hypothetical protein